MSRNCYDVYALRSAARLSRTETAKLCGVSERTVRRWENWNHYSGRRDATRPPRCVLSLLGLMAGELTMFGFPQWRLRPGRLIDPDAPANHPGYRAQELRAIPALQAAVDGLYRECGRLQDRLAGESQQPPNLYYLTRHCAPDCEVKAWLESACGCRYREPRRQRAG